jgi:hypothetical protein
MKNTFLISILAVFILSALLLLSAPLWGAWLGLDIHIHDHFFVIPPASSLLFLLLTVAAISVLALLIRKEIRRNRSAKAPRQ